MTGFENPQPIGISINSDGDIVFPFIADVTGTWFIAYDIYDRTGFAAVAGQPLTKVNDFAVNTDIVFKLIRPDNTLYGETSYLVNYDYQSASAPNDQKIGIVGDYRLVIDAGTVSGYTDLARFQGMVKWQVFAEGRILYENANYDPDTGTLSWDLAIDQEVVIYYFKP